MKVLQINIRASQGGAGRVCLDLHRRLHGAGIGSRLLYGYGSGIKDDPLVADDADVARTGSPPGVIGNYLWHGLFGRDIFTPGRKLIDDGVAAADIVHVHAPHHYFLNWDHLARALHAAGKPTVITAHDWWFITGRCGVVRDCSGWRRGCGECGAQRFEDLPCLFDFSAANRRRRQRSLSSLAAQTVFACPSQHLAADYRHALPQARIEVVPNGTDLEFEAAVAAQPDRPRSGILFSSADLSAPGKIDGGLVEAVARAGRQDVRLAGRNNPYDLPNCTWLGEIRQRERMVEVLKSSEALIFCSRMDNAPLTIVEAMLAGCYVIAYQAAGSAELIEAVGGRCVADRDEALAVIQSGAFRELYGGLTRPELSAAAARLFSGDTMAKAYLDLYSRMLEPTRLQHSPVAAH